MVLPELFCVVTSWTDLSPFPLEDEMKSSFVDYVKALASFPGRVPGNEASQGTPLHHHSLTLHPPTTLHYHTLTPSQPQPSHPHNLNPHTLTTSTLTPSQGTCLSLLNGLLVSEDDNDYLRTIIRIPSGPLLSYLEPYESDIDSGFENQRRDTSISGTTRSSSDYQVRPLQQANWQLAFR